MAKPKQSPTGYWSVSLSAKFPDGDMLYRPGRTILVDQALYERMEAAGAVESAEASELPHGAAA